MYVVCVSVHVTNEHVDHFIENHRSDLFHGLQFAQDGEHRLRPPQRFPRQVR